MELVSTRILDDTLEVTLADDGALTRLQGTQDEILALCDLMQQAAVLAGAATTPCWLPPLRVGDDIVRFGVAGGRVRMLTGPATR